MYRLIDDIKKNHLLLYAPITFCCLNRSYFVDVYIRVLNAQTKRALLPTLLTLTQRNAGSYFVPKYLTDSNVPFVSDLNYFLHVTGKDDILGYMVKLLDVVKDDVISILNDTRSRVFIQGARCLECLMDRCGIESCESLFLRCCRENRFDSVVCMIRFGMTGDILKVGYRESILHQSVDVSKYICKYMGYSLSDLLCTSVRDRRIKLVRELLGDKSISTEVLNKINLVKEAGDRKFYIVLDCLLSDERIDPSLNENKALYDAVVAGDIPYIRALLDCPRIRLDTRLEDIYKTAVKIGNKPVLDLLNGHPKFKQSTETMTQVVPDRRVSILFNLL